MTRWSSALAVAALVVGAPAAETARRSFERPCMATLFRVVIYSDRDPQEVSAAAGAAFAVARRLDAALSDYAGDTNMVGRINYSTPGDPQDAGDDLLDLLGRARELSEFSGGSFDPTAGALSWRWRLARRTGEIAGGDALDAAMASVGFHNIAVDRGARTITRRHPQTRLDFGAIGKGYAADRMLETLRDGGFPVSCVTAGGDVRVGDPPPGKTAWAVEVQPWGRRHGDPVVLQLANAAVSTSGDAEQNIEIDGVRYSHILDPRTGHGLTRPRAACVVAPTATESDALATAAAVAGQPLATKIADREGFACAVLQDPSSEKAAFECPRFRTLRQPTAPISP